MEFKYYIVYGNPKEFEGPEDWKKAMEKFGKVLKKYNMKLLFWGGSFGTTEGMVYVMKGSMEDYQSMFGKEEFAEVNPVASGQRTNMVLKF
jgi:hypothetical protein